MHVEKATQDTGLQNIHLMGREKKKKKIDNVTVLTTVAKHNNINYYDWDLARCWNILAMYKQITASRLIDRRKSIKLSFTKNIYCIN